MLQINNEETHTKKRKRGKAAFAARIAAMLALVFIIGYCVANMLPGLREYGAAKAAYDDLRGSVVKSIVVAPRETPENSAPGDIDDAPLFDYPGIDFAALRAANPEAAAWLWIPDTDISYPIARASDNEKYLRYAFDGTKNSSGCLFLDYRNASDFTDRHSIIYGHNMKNGSMFGRLKDFDNQDYIESHPYIYILTKDKARRYRVFSQYVVPETGADSYRLSFADDADFWDYTEYLKGLSLQNVKWTPGVGGLKPIVTLSTCVGDTSRRLLHAVLAGEIDY